jgi:hypothetical protein
MLLNNKALYNAVFRFIENSGDATLYAHVVVDALLQGNNTILVTKYINYLADNSAYLVAMQQAQWPSVGSLEWAEITEIHVHPDARITFEGFTQQELDLRFRLIPEHTTLNDPLYAPSPGIQGGIDGFFNRGWTNQRYWFKVSNGGSVTVRKLGNGFELVNIYEDPVRRLSATAVGKFYCTCWQDINQERPADNPFPQ